VGWILAIGLIAVLAALVWLALNTRDSIDAFERRITATIQGTDYVVACPQADKPLTPQMAQLAAQSVAVNHAMSQLMKHIDTLEESHAVLDAIKEHASALEVRTDVLEAVTMRLQANLAARDAQVETKRAEMVMAAPRLERHTAGRALLRERLAARQATAAASGARGA